MAGNPTALVLFGSETGKSADLADVLVDGLRRLEIPVKLRRFGESSVAEIVETRFLFVVCATTGQGALPANTRPFWLSLLRKGLSPTLFSGIHMACFGLGDTAYPKFNWAIRKIHSRLLQLGARDLIARGEADAQSPDGEDGVFLEWWALAAANLKTEFGLEPVHDKTELLPPWFSVTVRTDKMKRAPKDNTGVARAGGTQTATGVAKLIENTRITAKDHFQDVRHLVFEPTDSTPAEYEPGDTLTLYPSNADVLVEAFLESQNWQDIADHIVEVDPIWENEIEGGLVQPLTLRTLFTWHLDLNAVPARSFFALAAHFAADRQQEKMQEFSDGSADGLQSLYDYANRPRRSIAETVLEFETLKIPLEYILDLFPVLRPRRFSISSFRNRENVELTVALVKFKTILKRVRWGLCSRWLATLPLESPVVYTLAHSNLQLDQKLAGPPGTVILVATGTGIAPIRSFLGSYKGSDRLVLFFGSRFEHKDYLYHQEWATLKQKLDLVVVPAFSREGSGYVQSQIAAAGPMLAQKLPIKLVFVCGSSGKMPEAVREALAQALGESELRDLEKRGNYVQETW